MRLQTILGCLAVAFIVWWIIETPTGAAHVVHNIGTFFTSTGDGLSHFFASIWEKIMNHISTGNLILAGCLLVIIGFLVGIIVRMKNWFDTSLPGVYSEFHDYPIRHTARTWVLARHVGVLQAWEGPWLTVGEDGRSGTARQNNLPAVLLLDITEHAGRRRAQSGLQNLIAGIDTLYPCGAPPLRRGMC
jgi:hypothetical protein